jgi:dihydroneopterin aldolase
MMETEEHWVEVHGIRIYAYHGCLPEETTIGAEFFVDVSVLTDFTTGMKEDRLDGTLDYVSLTRCVEEEMSIPSKLIEHAADRIIQRVEAIDPHAREIRVKVIKPKAPVHADIGGVSVSLRKVYRNKK